MATLATHRRVHPRDADGRFDRPRSSALGLRRLSVPLATDSRQPERGRPDCAAGYRRADRTVETVGAERDCVARETQTDYRRTRKHHRDSGVYRVATMDAMIVRPTPQFERKLRIAPVAA